MAEIKVAAEILKQGGHTLYAFVMNSSKLEEAVLRIAANDRQSKRDSKNQDRVAVQRHW